MSEKSTTQPQAMGIHITIIAALVTTLLIGCGQKTSPESVSSERSQAEYQRLRQLQAESQEAVTKSIEALKADIPEGKTKFDFLKEK